MLHVLDDFWLQRNSEIFYYLEPIFSEHEKILQKIFDAWYILDEIFLEEVMREWNIRISIWDSKKFSEISESLAGSEFLPVLVFLHPDFEKMDWPWSFIKISLSYHTFSWIV